MIQRSAGCKVTKETDLILLHAIFVIVIACHHNLSYTVFDPEPNCEDDSAAALVVDRSVC